MAASTLPLMLDLRLPITTWLDDETFYSLCCRFHRVAGNATASRTAQQLFGHPRHGTQHDFASRINVFVQRTQGHFGNAEAIILHHTLLPFFLPWRAPADASYLAQTLANGQAGPLKSHLGLPASRVRAHHPLKACRQCMARDKNEHGVAYWHLAHQLPGVWVCLAHDCLLCESTGKATHVGRFLWHLPEGSEFYPQSLPENDVLLRIRALSEAAFAVLSLPAGTHIDPARLAKAYQSALYERGLSRGTSQIALEHAGQDYFRFTQRISPVVTDVTFPATATQVKLTLARRLSHPERSKHPITHLLIIIWLFGNWNAFWRTYQDDEPDTHHKTSNRPVCETGHCTTLDARKQKLLRLIEDRQISISRAAGLVGIAVQTAQIWASGQGAVIDRRFRLAKPTIRAIKKGLRTGQDMTYLAQKHSVSPSTVSRIAHTENGLHDLWQQARSVRRQHTARRMWIKTIATHPDAILGDLRTMAPASYSWLYRNDREWLQASLAGVPAYKHATREQVNWQERDEQLSLLVQAAIDTLSTTQSPGKPTTLQQLCHAVPTLKKYLGKRDRLPRTRCIIQAARRGEVSKSNNTTPQ